MKRSFEFSNGIRDKAFFRQGKLCAHCGRNLLNVWDEAHHVIPNQLGNPNNKADNWIKGVDNCVVLCHICHYRVHENGSFRIGAHASPDYYPFSHGKNNAAHSAWTTLMRVKFNNCR